MNKKLINGIAVVVTTVWCASFVIDALVPKYDPPVSVHAVMMLVAGAAFGTSIIPRKENNGK